MKTKRNLDKDQINQQKEEKKKIEQESDNESDELGVEENLE